MIDFYENFTAKYAKQLSPIGKKPRMRGFDSLPKFLMTASRKIAHESKSKKINNAKNSKSDIEATSVSFNLSSHEVI